MNNAKLSGQLLPSTLGQSLEVVEATVLKHPSDSVVTDSSSRHSRARVSARHSSSTQTRSLHLPQMSRTDLQNSQVHSLMSASSELTPSCSAASKSHSCLNPILSRQINFKLSHSYTEGYFYTNTKHQMKHERLLIKHERLLKRSIFFCRLLKAHR